MTPEAQRIAIAEACGFTQCDTGDGCWLHPQTLFHHTLMGSGGTMVLPNYLSDLNAIHAAQAILTDEQWSEYLSWIMFHHPKTYEWSGLRCVADSDAARLANAFLRTLNLWDDSK